MDISQVTQYRYQNLRRILANDGAKLDLARRLGHKNGAFISQMVSDNPTKAITEKQARKIEAAMGLRPRYLDCDPTCFDYAPVNRDNLIADIQDFLQKASVDQLKELRDTVVLMEFF